MSGHALEWDFFWGWTWRGTRIWTYSPAATASSPSDDQARQLGQEGKSWSSTGSSMSGYGLLGEVEIMIEVIQFQEVSVSE